VIAGRIAVISGAGSGIGQAIALAYARYGARLCLSDLSAAGIEETAERTGLAPQDLLLRPADIRDSTAIEALFSEAMQYFGRIDIALGAAGIPGPTLAVHDLSEAEWSDVIATNLTGAFYFGRAAARRMIPLKAGSIILITSQLENAAQKHCAAYIAAKGGAKMLVRAMAVDLAEHGVRVNALAPGFTDTPMTRGRGQEHSQSRIRALARIPMGRVAQPDEMAGAAVFLASDAAGYITGTTITVDGGYLAW
jgi:NAD(P)-dependent dehydrogenase (short-subunit alcohol dehydrogenase family)